MTRKSPVARYARKGLAGTLLAVSVALGGCKTMAHDPAPIAATPEDYRLRHPIAIKEANITTEVFVGAQRGGLSAVQRSDVLNVAQTWLREGTGTLVIDLPTGTPNARAAADSYREIQSLLASAGVPAQAVVTRRYRPADPRLFATIRVTYPRIAATAGPCGTWPEDLGPSVKNTGYNANTPYFNLGCASQRNLAAMVANPSDLVQPRAETPAYTSRRVFVLDKYRKGEATTTTYSDADKGKISSVGQ